MAKNDLDDVLAEKPGSAVIYLAGGCFWGLQKLMQSIPGVIDATSGYANGDPSETPTYPSVCTGATGHRETVRVVYDPARVSLDALLFAYFSVIDPTTKNAQGHDYGTQYQTGVYYADEASRATVARIADIERARHKRFVVEIAPISCFFEAEEYHQHYLDKNPTGYRHIPYESIRLLSRMVIDPADYRLPAKEIIARRLTGEQYRVTQDADTEPPFQNAFWDHFEDGIYVDVVTGEPLFSSADKYESACGWPSFSGGLDPNTLVYLDDRSHRMRRTEVRSRAGNSHLGHVFPNDSESPSGTRYCINSASLRFIPYDRMDEEGYGYLKERVRPGK